MFRNVVMAIDLNEEESWRIALPKAIEVAQGGVLHLVNVVPDYGLAIVGQYFEKDAESDMREAARVQLHAFAEEHVPDDIRASCLIGAGSVHVEILRMATEVGADLIVLGAPEPGLKDYLLGPTAAHIMRHAKVSVLVIRDQPRRDRMAGQTDGMPSQTCQQQV
ncbi:MAG: universal stress protein [Rhodospirillales bacterium]|nr:universal stress protein [Rhodospirillales bacterium]